MPAVSGILETALDVEDIERAARFYEEIFGFERLLSDQGFCAFSVAGKDMLLLFKRGGTSQPLRLPGGVIPPHGSSGHLHFAFSIAAEELDRWEKHLAAKGIAIEGRMHWERGGCSIYFRDPDQHLVELATPGIWPIY